MASNDRKATALRYRSSFEGMKGDKAPQGWQPVSHREDLRPDMRFVQDALGPGRGALCIRDSGLPDSLGKWVCRMRGVRGGGCYRLDVRFQTFCVASPCRSVYARVRWLDDKDEMIDNALQEYLVPRSDTGPDLWRICGTVEVPEKACAADVELALAWSPGGEARFYEVRFEKADPPKPRKVMLASVYLVPPWGSQPHENIPRFAKMVDQAADRNADLVCLPEGLTVVSVPNGDPHKIAEPIPGPSFDIIAARARERRIQVLACLPERVGPVIYNTAVLIDRTGKIVGKYRKTHLPTEEADRGYSPGNEYPVFDLEFGRVGIMICWDVFFPEPARALALKGAEVILLPVWGCNQALMVARAIENSVYLVSSSYNAPTAIVGPDGRFLDVIYPAVGLKGNAEQKCRVADPAAGGLAIHEVDLAKVNRTEWLGDFRTRMWRERRWDLANPLSDDLPPAP